MTRLPQLPKHAAIVAAAACLSACSPALDWREFVPQGSGLSVNLPCRPDHHARSVVLGSATVQMNMLVCSAGEATFALSYFDVADPARISKTLIDWRAAALGNVQARDAQTAPLQIKGMTPNAEAVRVSAAGRLPDGAAVQEHVAFFVHGLRVYQAAVIGAHPSAEAVDTFFGGLKFPA
jgi:hypothetical protein